MKRIRHIFLIFIIFQTYLKAQPFVEQSLIDLQGLDGSIPSWVDYDGDGDLDIFLTGYNGPGYSLLYQNNGDNTFTGFPDFGFNHGNITSSAWGDYDNDGDMDLIIIDGSLKTYIYDNSKNENFTKNPYINLPGSIYSSVDWGDFNDDGRLDILISGLIGGSESTQIWRNLNNNFFSKKDDDTLIGVFVGSGKWGDYDNDGDLDILLTGGTGNTTTAFTRIYTNLGHNRFNDNRFSELVKLCNYTGDADWGDYNNDGYLDVIVTGGSENGCQTGVFKNNGDNSFSIQDQVSIVGTHGGGNAVWGDYNNDGYLDIAINGYCNDNYYCKLYKNDQKGNFTEDTVILETFNNGECAWGDYDNDGDLDLLTSGDFKTKLYRNDIEVKNTPPSTPEGLSSTLYSDSVIFKWSKSLDTQTPQNGLSYNIYVYNARNDSLVVSPQAHAFGSVNNGFRLIAQFGKIRWSEKGYTLYGKFNSDYKWSVQSIDAGFSASSFAQEQYLGSINALDIPNSLQDILIYPNPASIELIISTDKEYSTLKIVNLLGVIYKSEIIYEKNKAVDIHDLPDGIYLIQLKSDNIISTKSFIKK